MAETTPRAETHERRGRRSTRLVAVVMTVVASTLFVASPVGTASACDALTISSLGLDRCVVDGGQAQIDAGNVVRVGYLSSTHVHWLAGHRTSHGATFNSLPSLEIGAIVAYRGDDYRVAEYELVNRRHPDHVMGWIGSQDDIVVLQTSSHGDYVHVWRADAVLVQAQSAPAPVIVESLAVAPAAADVPAVGGREPVSVSASAGPVVGEPATASRRVGTVPAAVADAITAIRQVLLVRRPHSISWY